MSAIFTPPITARLTRPADEPVMIMAVLDADQLDQKPGRPTRLLCCDRNGNLEIHDLTDVIIDWRYEFVPHRNAQGWTEYFHPDELAPPGSPQEALTEDDGLDDDT